MAHSVINESWYKTWKSLLKETAYPDGFSLEALSQLKTSEEVDEYMIGLGLSPIGEGETRIVYPLGPDEVLKVSNGRGKKVNQMEYIISNDPEVSSIAPRVEHHDPGFLWIVAEKVTPLTSWEEFNRVFGGNYRHLNLVLTTGQEMKSSNLDDLLNNMQAELGDTYEPFRGNQYVQALVKMVVKYNLHGQELVVYDHWGHTKDGRIVCLDYGQAY